MRGETPGFKGGSSGNTTWTPLTGGGFPVNSSVYKVSNGHCTLILRVDGGGAYPSGYVALTLPQAVWPAQQVIGTGQYGAALRPFFVNTDGTVAANGAASTGMYGTVTWPLGP